MWRAHQRRCVEEPCELIVERQCVGPPAVPMQSLCTQQHAHTSTGNKPTSAHRRVERTERLKETRLQSGSPAVGPLGASLLPPGPLALHCCSPPGPRSPRMRHSVLCIRIHRTSVGQRCWRDPVYGDPRRAQASASKELSIKCVLQCLNNVKA